MMSYDMPTSGDYARAAAERIAQDLHDLTVRLAEATAGSLGWTPPITGHPRPWESINRLEQEKESLLHLLEKAYTAETLEEVKALIGGSVRPK